MANEIKNLRYQISELKSLILSTIELEVNKAVDKYKANRVTSGEVRKNTKTDDQQTSLKAKFSFESVTTTHSIKQSNRNRKLKSDQKRTSYRSLAFNYASLEEVDTSSSDDEGTFPHKRKKKRTRRSASEIKKIEEMNKSQKILATKETKKATNYECEFCQDEFSNFKVYEKHFVNHEKELKELGGCKFSCPLCDNTFDELQKLFIHQGWCLNEKELRCLICKTEFKKLNDLTIHHHTYHLSMHESQLKFLKGCIMNREKGENRRSKQKCKYCSQKFKNARLFKNHTLQHLQEIHNTPKLLFNCPICEVQCKTVWGLNLHIGTHQNSNPACQECKEKFKDAFSLVLHHYKNHYKAPGPIKTFLYRIIAGVRTSRRAEKRKKIENIKKEKEKTSYNCDPCSKVFYKESTYKNHMATMHDFDGIVANNNPFSMEVSEDEEFSKSIKCPICDDECDGLIGLKLHSKHHTAAELLSVSNRSRKGLTIKGVKVYNCNACSESFFVLSKYRKHVFDSHLDNKELRDKFCFNCDLCDKSFYRESSLNFHKKVHGEFFQCPVCCENCINKDAFLIHLNEVHSINNNESFVECKDGFLCKICGIKLETVKKISKHIKVNHSEKPFMCDICGNSYSREKLLKHHKNKTHLEKTLLCGKCGKKFKTKYNLKNHMKTHKDDDTARVPCTTCDKTFASESTYQTHFISMHTNTRPYKCTVCSQTFTNAPQLYVHKVTVCEKDKAKISTCDICEKSFENYLSLFYHKKNVHKYGNTDDNVCLICNKTFGNANKLYSHCRHYHTAENGETVAKNNCVCNMCGQSRPNSRFLFEHWLTHRPEKVFSCDLCNLEFKQKCGYYQHKKLTHLTPEMKEGKMITNKPLLQQLKKEFKILNSPTSSKYAATSQPAAPPKSVRTPQTAATPKAPRTTNIVRSPETASITVGSGSTSEENENEESVELGNQEISSEEDTRDDLALIATVGDRNEYADINILSATIQESHSPAQAKYVDFSRANVPEKCQAIAETPPSNNDKHKSSVESRVAAEAADSETNEQIAANQEYICDNEIFDSDLFDADDIASPMEHYDCDSSDIKPLVSYIDVILPDDPFPRKLVVELERLSKCLICKEYFASLDLYNKHANSKKHRAAAKEKKMEENNNEVIEVRKKNKIKSVVGQRKRRKRKEIGIFACPHCDEKLSSADKYRRHCAQHKIRAKCLLCPERFVTVRRLVDHYVSNHNEEKIIRCEICNKGFLDYSGALRDHMSYQHSTENRKKLQKVKSYRCNICGEKCKEMKSYRIHLLSHTNDKHECAHCKKEVKTQIELEKHYNKIHNGDMPFPCQECSLKSLTPYRLQCHVQEAHLKEKRDPKDGKIACDICGQRYLKMSELRYHKTIHNPIEERRKYFCEFCARPFLRVHSLNIHRRIHTGEKPYVCSLCETNNSFTCSQLLKEHMDRVHKANSHICDICGRSFNRRKNLVVHRRLHPSDGNPDNSCGQCSKAFDSTVKLRHHVDNVHAPDAINKIVLTCAVCYAEYYTPESFDRHSKLHDPNRPFPCDQCSFRFMHRSNLILHVKGIHEKMGTVYPKKKKVRLI